MEAGIIVSRGCSKNVKMIVLILGLVYFNIGICDKVGSNTNIARTNIQEMIEAVKRASQQIQDRGIPKDYNINDPPLPSDGEPLGVDVAVTVFDIRDVIEMNGEITLEVNLRMAWKDIRLRHMSNNWNYAVLHPSLLDKIWHPDLFINHVKKVDQPKLMSMPAYLRIYNDSTIRYSARLTIGMACQMDFHHYPADTQRCHVDLKSYAYLDTALNLRWDGKEAAIRKGLILQNFVVALGDTDHTTTVTSAGNYTGLRFTIVLKRKLSFHVIQTYVPSALFVLISWLSFLIAPELVPGRMTLCMTTLLTLIAMFASIRQNSPSVSYVKGLDIWMVVCVFFVFLTLLEYTTVLQLRSRAQNSGNSDEIIRYDSAKLAVRLENYCSKLIPILFVIFIIIYWPWLLITSNYYDEKELLETRFV